MKSIEERSVPRWQRRITGVFLKILVLVFICELAVMAFLYVIKSQGVFEILFDPIILAALTTPLLYHFVFHPLQEALKQRQMAVEALQTSQEKYRELADLLPQTVFELDMDGNFTYSNRYGFDSTGYTQEDIDNGLNALQLFSPEDQERIKQNIVKLINGEQINANEYTLKRKDGSLVPVLIYSRPILRDGKPVGLRGIVVDITDRKRMERELQNNIAELEQFNKMAVGRELKMIELKSEVNDLLSELGREEKYQIAAHSDVQELL